MCITHTISLATCMCLVLQELNVTRFYDFVVLLTNMAKFAIFVIGHEWMSMKHSLTFNFECSDIYTPTQIVVVINSMYMVKNLYIKLNNRLVTIRLLYCEFLELMKPF